MVNLAIGEKIIMEFSTFGDRFVGVVTDVENDGRLFTYVRLVPPIVQRLKMDPTVQVRFAYEGSLLGFRTRVLNKVTESGTILELAMPESIYDAEERAEPRCSCDFPATLVKGAKTFQAMVEDMSANSTRVRLIDGSSAWLVENEGQEVQLTFFPFDQSEGYSVHCTVRSDYMKDGGRYAILDFKHDQYEVRERVARFVEAKVCCGFPRL